MYGTYLRLGIGVNATDREVIAATRKKIKASARGKHEHRSARHRVYSQMLTFHKNARDLYRDVMFGDISE